MPIYEFRCDECEILFEHILPVGHRGAKRCPTCRKRARRVMSRSSFQLKGSGWYATDYKPARKPAGKGSAREAGDGASSAANS